MHIPRAVRFAPVAIITALAGCSGTSVDPGKPNGQAVTDGANHAADGFTQFVLAPGNGIIVAGVILTAIGVGLVRWCWRSQPFRFALATVVVVTLTLLATHKL